MAVSVERLVTGSSVRGSYLEVGKGFFLHKPSSLLLNGYGSVFPGLKQPRHEFNHTPFYLRRLEVRNDLSYNPPVPLDGVDGKNFTICTFY
jgi:hypothetical protein